jgi:hypothetical protein
MLRPKGVPGYRRHRASGQAHVIIDGRHIYLGPGISSGLRLRPVPSPRSSQPPSGRVSSGPTFLPSDSCSANKISRMARVAREFTSLRSMKNQ